MPGGHNKRQWIGFFRRESFQNIKQLGHINSGTRMQILCCLRLLVLWYCRVEIGAKWCYPAVWHKWCCSIRLHELHCGFEYFILSAAVACVLRSFEFYSRPWTSYVFGRVAYRVCFHGFQCHEPTRGGWTKKTIFVTVLLGTVVVLIASSDLSQHFFARCCVVSFVCHAMSLFIFLSGELFVCQYDVRAFCWNDFSVFDWICLKNLVTDWNISLRLCGFKNWDLFFGKRLQSVFVGWHLQISELSIYFRVLSSAHWTVGGCTINETKNDFCGNKHFLIFWFSAKTGAKPNKKHTWLKVLLSSAVMFASPMIRIADTTENKTPKGKNNHGSTTISNNNSSNNNCNNDNSKSDSQWQNHNHNHKDDNITTTNRSQRSQFDRHNNTSKTTIRKHFKTQTLNLQQDAARWAILAPQ